MVEAPSPVGDYLPYVRYGPLVFLSAISSARGGQLIIGKVGVDIDVERAREAAARAARNLLAVLGQAVDGDMGRVDRLLFVRGYVNASDGFHQVQRIIDAASEVLIAELGKRGRHARTSIGCSSLPNGNSVTLEAIAAVHE